MNKLKRFAYAFLNLRAQESLSSAVAYLLRSIRLTFLPRLSNLRKPEDGVLPSVEMAFIVGNMDYEIAQKTIRNNISRSLNPVTRIRVISQDSNFALKYPGIEIDHIEESKLISDFVSSLARKSFGNRAGWTIQQMLKLHACSTASIPLVIIDADTEFLKPTVFVDKKHRIVIPCSPTRNREYDSALTKLGLIRNFMSFSHVLHFIVVDPQLIGDSLRNLNLHTPSASIETIINLEQDLFSLDYEALNEIMTTSSKSGWRLVKVKNRDGQRSDFLDPEEDYDSISYHHYLQ